jgi:hypothetical protein
MSYVTLRSLWCNIIILKGHAPTEDKNDTKGSFYKGLECVFVNSRSTTKNLLGDLNVKVVQEDIFKPVI